MTSPDREIKRQVREFYNQVGWREISDGLYQNARYEDLRPVSQEYIHRCHMRVMRYLAPAGRFLLDAGSGPIQYPEYLEYSRGYQKRVCADISHTALKEAQKRLGEKGLYVVADVTRLPFAADRFDGLVSLHTIHHLPVSEHLDAYMDLYRVLAPGRTAVVVNGWDTSPLMDFFDRIKARLKGRKGSPRANGYLENTAEEDSRGTFVNKNNPAWLKQALDGRFRYKIRVWRSASTNFLRFFIRTRWGGRAWLRLLFWLEDRFPRFFGEKGLYPMVVITK
jgi:ubiquinone/menaquinone biosynthesis C-methylase UbiE